jgi:predicted RNA binding protein YcfA (HicA-like mRNA interferase family)
MARLRTLSGADLLSIFALFGFTPFTRLGSHVRQTLTVVAHRGADKGTLAAIYRQALRYIPEDRLRPYFFTEGTAAMLTPVGG